MSKLYVNEVHSKTGSTKALEINSNGVVQQPKVPAVYGVNLTARTGSGVKFTGWTIRVDNNSDWSNDEFTCPVDGIYEVTANIWRSSGVVQYNIRKNGTSEAAVRQSTTDDEGANMTILLNCSASDTIDFYRDNMTGTIYGASSKPYESLTSFTIKLVG